MRNDPARSAGVETTGANGRLHPLLLDWNDGEAGGVRLSEGS
jgi:hypothetical protein